MTGNKMAIWTRVLLYVIAAVGVPVTVIVILSKSVESNVLVAIAFFLVYQVVLILISFAAEVARFLRGWWARDIAKWIDRRVRNATSRFLETYNDNVMYRYRFVDLKGLTTQGTYDLELARTYVQLRITPLRVVEDALDMLRKSDDGGKDIWDFLASEQLSTRNFAVIGAPGSGKSTLLRHVAIRLSQEYKSKSERGARHKLPVLLLLRNCSRSIRTDEKFMLVDAIREDLTKWGASPPNDWIEDQLARGQCLVMLDGLDEVAAQQDRQLVAAWVERQMVAYPENRFIITSRPFGFQSTPISGVAKLDVLPFTVEQVEKFVESWYVATGVMRSQKDDQGVRLTAQQGARDLLERLRGSDALYELAVNPLLLTMITTVHYYRSALPGKRVELYEQICDVFLGQRDTSKGVIRSELDSAQKQLILQPLAYAMMRRQVRDMPVSEALEVIGDSLQRVSPAMSGTQFLKLVADSSGILLERESGRYGFAHLTFQEYLASTFIREKGYDNDLLRFVDDSWWHEVIRLYCARTDATSIVMTCLDLDRPTLGRLLLAMECVFEAREVDKMARDRLDQVLRLGVEDPEPDRRRITAEALLRLRLQRFARLDESRYADDSLIRCAEYQLYISDSRHAGQYRQPDAWPSYEFAPGFGLRPVLGVRPSDVIGFCDWLYRREQGQWTYRMPAIGELSQADDAFIRSKVTAAGAHWETSNGTYACDLSGTSPRAVSFTSVMARMHNDLALAIRYSAASVISLSVDMNSVDRLLGLSGAANYAALAAGIIELSGIDAILAWEIAGMTDLSQTLQHALRVESTTSVENTTDIQAFLRLIAELINQSVNVTDRESAAEMRMKIRLVASHTAITPLSRGSNESAMMKEFASLLQQADDVIDEIDATIRTQEEGKVGFRARHVLLETLKLLTNRLQGLFKTAWYLAHEISMQYQLAPAEVPYQSLNLDHPRINAYARVAQFASPMKPPKRLTEFARRLKRGSEEIGEIRSAIATHLRSGVSNIPSATDLQSNLASLSKRIEQVLSDLDSLIPESHMGATSNRAERTMPLDSALIARAHAGIQGLRNQLSEVHAHTTGILMRLGYEPEGRSVIEKVDKLCKGLVSDLDFDQVHSSLYQLDLQRLPRNDSDELIVRDLSGLSPSDRWRGEMYGMPVSGQVRIVPDGNGVTCSATVAGRAAQSQLPLETVRSNVTQFRLAAEAAFSVANILELNLDQSMQASTIQDLARAVEAVLDRDTVVSARYENRKAVKRMLHWHIRLAILLRLARVEGSRMQAPFQRHKSSEGKFGPTNPTTIVPDAALVEALGKLYFAFHVLDERIEGTLPAFEGIQVIRERRRSLD